MGVVTYQRHVEALGDDGNVETAVVADRARRGNAHLALAKTLWFGRPTGSSGKGISVGHEVGENHGAHASRTGQTGRVEHLTSAQLEGKLDYLRSSPPERGTVELIVRRPAVDEREVLEEGRLDLAVGLVGDTWSQRGSKRTADGSPHPDMQLNVMNARCIELLAQSRERWPLAGDQLYVELDLSVDNLPPGTRLALGTAVIEVTEQPHRGCAKFTQRFGIDAFRFINSEEGRVLRLRGLNAKVVLPGVVRRGDVIAKLAGVAAAQSAGQRRGEA